MGSALTPTSTRREHLSPWYDIRDFGAVPNNVAGCDAAIDAALAKMDLDDPTLIKPAVLYFPDGTWSTRRTIYAARSNLTIRGAGRMATIISPANDGIWYQHHLLMLGVLKRPGGVAFPASAHYVDAFGVMDATFASAAGRRYGWALDGSQVAFWGAAPNLAAGGYEQSPQLTISFALDSRGSYTPRGCVGGMGDASAGGRPWTVVANGSGTYLFRFRTTDVGAASNGYREFQFSQGALNKGLHEATICVDLTAGVYYAFVNRTQVAVTLNSGTGLPWVGGLTFERNYCFPFLFGAASPMAGLNGYPSMAATLYGFWVGKALRYANGAVGSAQAPADGTTLSDADLFLKYDQARALWWLPMTDKPTGPFDGREVTYSEGFSNGPGKGLWFTTGLQGNGTNNTGPQRACDLTLLGNLSYPFGDALTLGGSYNAVVQDVDGTGGSHGIGSANFGSSYPLTIQDGTFTGRDACVFLSQTIYISMARVTLTAGSAETALRMFGCAGRFEDLFIVNQLQGRYSIAIHSQGYSGFWYFDGVVNDNEGVYAPTVADFYYEECGGGTANNRLVIRNATMGTAGADCAFLMIQEQIPGDEAAGYYTPELVLDGVRFDGGRAAVVRSTGRLTTGQVEAARPLEGSTPWLVDASPGGVGTGLRTVHRKLIAPPNVSAWLAGAHEIVPAPARPGLYTRYGCVKSGSYGTTTPPVWAGLDRIELTGNEMGAFSTGQDRVVVTGTYASTSGCLTIYARNAEIDSWLRGVTLPGAGTYLALSNRRNVVNEIGIDPSPPHAPTLRAPVSAGTWNAPSGRSVTNALAITFPSPTFTASFPGRSIYLANAADQVLWIVNVATPIPVVAGAAGIVIPAGAITVTF